MAAVGPFEASPHLAVAVSGGADSMALCLLAHGWSTLRGGRVSALTVDHGLRPGSRSDVLQVGKWLRGRGIEHTVLSWVGEKPATGIQEAARSARYGLITQWCVQSNVLHLLLGHHRQDQAETVLMRQCRASGLDGLAGMASVVETAEVRRLRPLLNTPPARLRAVLLAVGQPWIEDPSNSDPAYTRNRVRALLPRLSEGDSAVSSVIANSARMAQARMTLARAASTLLARCCQVYSCGYARFDARAMAAAPPEVAARALGGLMATIGGRMYAPAPEKLERVFFQLIRENTVAGVTLGRCRLDRSGDRVLVCRESRGLPSPRLMEVDGPTHWDGRFLIDCVASAGNGAGPVRLAALGASGVNQMGGAVERSPFCLHRVPRPARLALPALADDAGVLAVPHLDYQRPDVNEVPICVKSICFRPHHVLSGGSHYLA